MGIEGSCQGQERGREGTRTKGEQAGPQISSLCSLQGPKVWSRKSQGLSKSSLQLSPAASTLCTLPSPSRGALPHPHSRNCSAPAGCGPAAKGQAPVLWPLGIPAAFLPEEVAWGLGHWSGAGLAIVIQGTARVPGWAPSQRGPHTPSRGVPLAGGLGAGPVPPLTGRGTTLSGSPWQKGWGVGGWWRGHTKRNGRGRGCVVAGVGGGVGPPEGQPQPAGTFAVPRFQESVRTTSDPECKRTGSCSPEDCSWAFDN